MPTLAENIQRAITNFDDIKQAIIDKGVDIPSNTPVEEYKNKIMQITCKCNNAMKDIRVISSYPETEDEDVLYLLADNDGDFMEAKLNGKIVFSRQYFTNYNIYGNSVQNGIPTPDNPIEINSTGQKEGKLLLRSGNVVIETPLQEPLRGLPNGLADDLEYRKIKKFVFNGSENWVTSGAAVYDGAITTNRYLDRTEIKGYHHVNDELCSHLKHVATVWSGDVEGRSQNVTQIHLRFRNDILGITESDTSSQRTQKFKAYLASHSVEYYAELVTPVPQNITRPRIRYFGAPLTILNEVQPRNITYETESGVIMSGQLLSGYKLLADEDGNLIVDANNNLIAVKGE